MLTAVFPLLAATAVLAGGPPRPPVPEQYSVAQPQPPADLPPAVSNGPLPPNHPHGYLWTYRQDDHGRTVRLVETYCPKEGDWLFFDDMSKWWTFLYKIGNTAPPFHAGIVVKKPDGQLAVLESGPDDTLHVFVLDLIPRLQTFKGILQVRRCKRVLTPDESARLTAFAEAQKGKRYAVWRLLAQGTPIKTKGGPLREACAHTLFDRRRWLCAEITVTGSAVVGLTDPKKVCGSNTYPLDIIDNHKHPELAEVYEEFAYWSIHP